MSGQTAEADVDADVFHAFTQKITIVDIKNALSRKFRPEQVARFGNTHVIYHSLKRQDFTSLIERESRARDRADQDAVRHHAESRSDRSASLIYRNGVFPVQGVRPVFSSVMDILEASLAPLIIDAVLARHENHFADL